MNTMNRKEARAIARAALEGRSGDEGELFDVASDAVLAALVGTDVPDDDVQDIARDAAQWAVYEHQEAATNDEKQIARDHKADVDNGLTEAEASESDAFERRVLGLSDDNEHDRYGDAGYSGCYD